MPSYTYTFTVTPVQDEEAGDIAERLADAMDRFPGEYTISPLELVIPEDEEPAFDENHYRYHTPAGPNPECPNCAWLNWSQPPGDSGAQGGEEVINHDTVREQAGEDA
jgi:hypothetical protein